MSTAQLSSRVLPATHRWMASNLDAMTGVVLLIFAVIALWNATAYDWRAGYDAVDHKEYADLLLERGELPRATGEYYTPPGFYLVAGATERLGDLFGLDEPERLPQLLNALLTIGTAILLLGLARELWPGRRLLAFAAVVFFAACPVALKTAAMFHPEPLDLFLSTLALRVAARMLVRNSFALLPAVMLGLVLGAAQLVRAFALWTVAVVVVALVVAALADPGRRRAALGSLALVAVVSSAVAAPWYVRQARLYSNPIFDRPQPEAPLWERRPARFYFDLGFPEIVTDPQRSAYSGAFLPLLYTETWGDYFGIWAWGPPKGADSEEEARVVLAVQSLAGLAPTVLAVAGWLALLGLSIRLWRTRTALLLPALLPLAGLAGLLYFSVSYPTPDGDTVKGTYMLTTLPAWALAFGLAADRLRERRVVAIPLAIALAISIPATLLFGVYVWA